MAAIGYLTLDAANALLAAYPTWTALTEVQKTESLQRAFELMETLRYQGYQTVSTQTTAWPRNGVVILGTLVDSATVPAPILRAQALEALRQSALLTDAGALKRRALQDQGVTEREVGEVTETYANPRTALCPEAYACVSRYLARRPLIRP